MDKPLYMWAVFLGIILFLVTFDLGFLNKDKQEIGVKKSLLLSAFYIVIGVLFSGYIYYSLGVDSFAEYLTGFLVEKSLSLDNVFVISIIFSSLSIPKRFQHRVLFWGILGVLVLRAIMIGLGAQLVQSFSWVLYIFAIFMILTGVKILFVEDKPMDIKNNPILKWLHKRMRVTNSIENEKFILKKNGILYATPLLIALILIELVDLLFAVDSVPAIFTITRDPYIIYTSNIFAIIGLRALYFAIASIVDQFHYLKYSLALILMFIGSKIFIADILQEEKFPPVISLSITFILLFSGLALSVLFPKKK